MRFWKRKKSPAKAPKGFENLLPPEGVPLQFKIASTGVRLAAQITDILITAIGAIAVLLFFVALNFTNPGTLSAIASMLFFIIRVPYYVLSELLWNGQTLGKRMTKIKVISANGGSLKADQLVMRNLMKEAEIFLPGTLLFTLSQSDPISSGLSMAWIIAVLAVPLLNRRRQRLGDLLAGTFVIHLPEPVLLRDMSRSKRATEFNKDAFTFLTHHLDHYGTFELQTLEDLLRAGSGRQSAQYLTRRKATLDAVVAQIRRKIDYADPVAPDDHETFLAAFYNAQRAYLEQRQLFGEKRADKTHAKAADKNTKQTP